VGSAADITLSFEAFTTGAIWNISTAIDITSDGARFRNVFILVLLVITG
jgi:hypothetical protein